MITKSYQVENNKRFYTEDNCFLFYGENLGLKKEFKEKFKQNNLDAKIINLHQEEILKKENLFFQEVMNLSLFDAKKIVFIDSANDKIFKILEKITDNLSNIKIILFSEILDKKSKLRNFFEKSKIFNATACYPDNELTIKKIISEKLKKFTNLNRDNINLICEKSNLDRIKLNNDLEKILIYFKDKKIFEKDLEKLLDIKLNDDFNALKDEAFLGNKINTNKLLNETNIYSEKSSLYVNLIFLRLITLKEILIASKSKGLENAVNTIKPPIFWKDKSKITIQTRKWSLKKIIKLLNLTYEVEKKIKSNNNLTNKLVVKNLIIDICNLANAA